MKMLAAVALTTLLMTGVPVLGQTGPAPPRMVYAALPLEGPRPGTPDVEGMPRIVEVTLSVDANGAVTDVMIRDSFGDAQFDEKVRQYYRRLRLVPALDALGVPIAGTIDSNFIVAKDRLSSAHFDPSDVVFKDPPFPKHNAQAGRADVPRTILYNDRDRVRRMTCGDFLWEYDLMSQMVAGAGEHALDIERPMATAISMYMAEHEARGRQLEWVNENTSVIIGAMVQKCRVNPAEKYWQDVVEPTMRAMLLKSRGDN